MTREIKKQTFWAAFLPFCWYFHITFMHCRAPSGSWPLAGYQSRRRSHTMRNLYNSWEVRLSNSGTQHCIMNLPVTQWRREEKKKKKRNKTELIRLTLENKLTFFTFLFKSTKLSRKMWSFAPISSRPLSSSSSRVRKSSPSVEPRNGMQLFESSKSVGKWRKSL